MDCIHVHMTRVINSELTDDGKKIVYHCHDCGVLLFVTFAPLVIQVVTPQ